MKKNKKFNNKIIIKIKKIYKNNNNKINSKNNNNNYNYNKLIINSKNNKILENTN